MLLDEYGFSEVFLNVSTCNYFVKHFPSIFKSRNIDCLYRNGLVRLIETES